MRKIFFLLAFVILVLVGCTAPTANVEPEQSKVASDAGTQSIQDEIELPHERLVIEELQSQVPKDWAVQLPQAIPVEQGSYLSATTFRSGNRLTIHFYESKHKLEVNSPSLETDETHTGTLIVTSWKTEQLAADYVAQLNRAFAWQEGTIAYEIQPQLYEEQWRQVKQKHMK